MSKILKNTTGSPISISDTGVLLPASPVVYTIPPQDYLLWAASSNIITYIGNGTVIVNDGSTNLSISDGIDLIKDIFPKKIGVLSGNDLTPIGHVGDRLKVDTQITSISGGISASYSSKLRMEDMNATTGGIARGATVSNAAWSSIYYYLGSGLFTSAVINIEGKDGWLLRIVIDGEEILGSGGLKTTDLHSDSVYDLDVAGKTNNDVDSAVGLYFGEHDRIIFQGPLGIPIKYNSSVQILLRRDVGQSSKKFQAGLAVLTKET
jgi:hypothetical protein